MLKPFFLLKQLYEIDPWPLTETQQPTWFVTSFIQCLVNKSNVFLLLLETYALCYFLFLYLFRSLWQHTFCWQCGECIYFFDICFHIYVQIVFTGWRPILGLDCLIGTLERWHFNAEVLGSSSKLLGTIRCIWFEALHGEVLMYIWCLMTVDTG